MAADDRDLTQVKAPRSGSRRLGDVAQDCEKGPSAGEPVTPEVADARLRAAIRISSDYVLRSLQIVRALASNDLIEGLVILAIVQANVGHLVNPDATGGGGATPPDELRRPVSVMALSANLNIPYETMRRHVAKLLAAGVCVRAPGGVIVPGSQLGLPQNKAALQENLVNLRRLYRALTAAGIDLD